MLADNFRHLIDKTSYITCKNKETVFNSVVLYVRSLTTLVARLYL